MKTHPTERRKRRGGTRAEVRNLPKCVKCNHPIGPGLGYETEVDEHGRRKAWHAVRLYFDECAAAIPKTLQEMGFCIEPSLPKGTPDLEWLVHAGTRGCVVVTQDARIAQNPIERQALIDNDVKCFILPGSPKNAWDLVRGFVTMWEKIRVESAFPGPFIWKCNDRSSPVRWERLYPEDSGYAPFDLARTPTGHLLNLFADVVHMHDNGWLSRPFVEGLHENIRCELEARVSRDRSKALEPSPDWQRLLSEKISPKSQKESHEAKLDEPFDVGKKNQLIISMDNETGVYQWIIPAHMAGDNVVGPGVMSTENAFAFQAGPVGFHRSGFGLRVMRSKRSGSRPRPGNDILTELRREFDTLRGHLEVAVDQWRRARESMANPRGIMADTSDLFDALRMRCVWIQERIQAVHQIHGSFWKDYRQELALEMKPIHAVFANGYQIDNSELDRLVQEVVKPLHHAVKRTRFAANSSVGVRSVVFDRETIVDFLSEATARAETPSLSAGFTMVSVHEGEPLIFRMCPEVDADGRTRRVAVTSSKAIDGRVEILGKLRRTVAEPSD